MSEILKKFVSRAPRYILKPEDDHFLRFAFNHLHGHKYTTLKTRFVNLSLTGMAFVVNHENCPLLGQKIMIEFPVPGGGQIAWWGEVVRLERYTRGKWWLNEDDFAKGNDTLVGIRFMDMPSAHRKVIKRNLDQKFLHLLREQRWTNFRSLNRYVFHSFGKAIFYFCILAGAIWFLYYLSQPSDNYDEKRGAPWGQRFNNWHKDF